MKIDSALLDALTQRAKESPRLRMHQDLRDTPEDGSMRMLNALEPGTDVPVHRHSATSEDIICIRGDVDVVLYDETGAETERVNLVPGSDCQAIHIPAGIYHASRSNASGSVILEFKNTKYDPATCEEVLKV